MWLGIDTSGAVSVAIGRPVDAADAGTPRSIEVLAVGSDTRARHHDEVLLGLVDGVLADAGVRRRDLTAVVAGRGPGPFTGLRVGLVVARTVAAMLDVPLYGICSLDALAEQVAAGEHDGDEIRGTILVALDARRREVYWATYRIAADGRCTRIDGPHVDRPDAVTEHAREAAAVVGSGAHLYPQQLPPTADLQHVDAGFLLRAAAQRLHVGDDLTQTDPLYLREPDAAKPSARKSALGR